MNSLFVLNEPTQNSPLVSGLYYCKFSCNLQKNLSKNSWIWKRRISVANRVVQISSNSYLFWGF